MQHRIRRPKLAKTQRLGWALKGPIFAAVLVLGFFDHALHGWGRPGVAAAIALILPIFGYRRFWDHGRFWFAAGSLILLQAPVVVLVRGAIEHSGLLGLMTFGLIDCILVAFVLARVVSDPAWEKPRSGGTVP